MGTEIECPECGTDNYYDLRHESPVWVDSEHIYIDNKCERCETEWREHYELYSKEGLHGAMVWSDGLTSTEG